MDLDHTQHNPLAHTQIGKLLSLTSLYRGSLARMQLARQPVRATAVSSAESVLKRALGHDIKVIQSEIKGRVISSHPSSVIPRSPRPLTCSLKAPHISYTGKDGVRIALRSRSSELLTRAMDNPRSAVELRSSVLQLHRSALELPRRESPIKQCNRHLEFPRVLYRRKAQLGWENLLKQEISSSKLRTSKANTAHTTPKLNKTHSTKFTLSRAPYISAPVSPKSTKKERYLPIPIKPQCKGLQARSTPRPWSQTSFTSAVLHQQGI
jgi:hypothetical protein